MTDLERCRREAEECWNGDRVQPAYLWLMGWADWQIEMQYIQAEMEHDSLLPG